MKSILFICHSYLKLDHGFHAQIIMLSLTFIFSIHLSPDCKKRLIVRLFTRTTDELLQWTLYRILVAAHVIVKVITALLIYVIQFPTNLSGAGDNVEICHSYLISCWAGMVVKSYEIHKDTCCGTCYCKNTQRRGHSALSAALSQERERERERVG